MQRKVWFTNTDSRTSIQTCSWDVFSTRKRPWSFHQGWDFSRIRCLWTCWRVFGQTTMALRRYQCFCLLVSVKKRKCIIYFKDISYCYNQLNFRIGQTVPRMSSNFTRVLMLENVATSLDSLTIPVSPTWPFSNLGIIMLVIFQFEFYLLQNVTFFYGRTWLGFMREDNSKFKCLCGEIRCLLPNTDSMVILVF